MNKENLAVIVGGTGAIGNAIANEIEKLGFKEVLKIGTKTNPSIDFNDENTIIKTTEFIKNKISQFQFYLMQQEFCIMMTQCQKKL